MFAVTYEKPRIEAASAAPFGSVRGVEAFDRLAPGSFGAVESFTTTFGTGGMIAGVYSGAIGLYSADQYGGAGGGGNYMVAFGPAKGYTLTLSHDEALPGINEFALDISALDGGNRLDFMRAGEVVYSYTPEVLIEALGTCSEANLYCGNPSTRANQGEQYAFVSFLDRTGYFDQVWFHQADASGGFETDNHTVSYLAPSAFRAAAVDVPEPFTVALLGAGMVALGMARRAWRNPEPG